MGSQRNFRPSVGITLLILSLLFGASLILKKLAPTAPRPIQVAVAMPMSGPMGEDGKQMLNAIKLCFDDVNRQGDIQGHAVQVVAYDDEGKSSVAQARAKEIVRSPALAVVGHLSSALAIPAGEIYKNEHLPAITASATSPAVTSGNEFYFRVSNDTSAQGHLLAAYAIKALGKSRASILYGDDSYGKGLRAAFADEYAEQGGTLSSEWAWDPNASDAAHAAMIQKVSTDIANGQGEIVILAISPYESAGKALTLLRRTGVNPVILGGTSLGNNFAQLFTQEPEEKREPGFFAQNTYLASAIIYDSASERALTFNERFSRTFHSREDERVATYYNAALLPAAGLQHAPLQLTGQSRNDERERIRDWLAAQSINSTPVQGLSGPVYFDSSRNFPQPVRIGRCVEGQLISAPTQLEPVPNRP